MVTMRSVGLSVPTGTEHERRSSPFTCTEHEPHCATPHPNLVPVSPACSRSAQSSGVSSSTFRSRTAPLMFSLAIDLPPVQETFAILPSGRRHALHLAPQHLADVGLRQLLPEL